MLLPALPVLLSAEQRAEALSRTFEKWSSMRAVGALQQGVLGGAGGAAEAEGDADDAEGDADEAEGDADEEDEGADEEEGGGASVSDPDGCQEQLGHAQHMSKLAEARLVELVGREKAASFVTQAREATASKLDPVEAGKQRRQRKRGRSDGETEETKVPDARQLRAQQQAALLQAALLQAQQQAALLQAQQQAALLQAEEEQRRQEKAADPAEVLLQAHPEKAAEVLLQAQQQAALLQAEEEAALLQVQQQAARLHAQQHPALLQAQAEGLVLRVAKSKTGYAGVYHMGSRYEARISIRIHGQVSLGSFATAEEAAVRVARAEAVLSMVPGRDVKRRARK